jgi:rod shape-determining protein MreD
MRSGVSQTRIVVSCALALILTVLPMPHFLYYLDVVRPAFLVVTIVYWSVAAPWAGCIGLGWFFGLVLDVFQGPVLGEHALVLSALAAIFVSEHQRVRSKPMFQQSLIVMFALGAYEGFLFLIDEYSGHPVTSPLRWLHAISDGIIWPVAYAILGYRERRV